MTPHKLRSDRFPIRRIGAVLAWALLFLGVAVVANLVGIGLVGDVHAWEQWMRRHSAWFLIWRLVLYAGTVTGWIWMRKRLLAREQDRETGHHLLRLEIAAVATILVLEASLLFQSA
ncbi:hypothetical protein ACO34A_23690 (plasmid) [Rhizobium sp. ACO-34A]|nr:hypothetical protein [Rhizobium sp. ACO-34A]ATN36788.1 hypothetical protein ACO34A_23690 [Rhizobium sp. ACO-34A]